MDTHLIKFTKTPRVFLIYAGLFLVVSGCSISYSFTGASIPPGSKTVSVSSFPNMALLVNPTLSMTFEEALKDKFVSQTSLQLVGSDGDLQFEGSIVEYFTQPMSVQANSDVAAQNRLTIGIKVKFTNLKDPKTNFDTKFSRYADYDSEKNLQDVENDLVTVIVDELVDDIFNKAVVNW